VDVGSIGRTTYKLLSCDCVRVASQDPEEELAASNLLTVWWIHKHMKMPPVTTTNKIKDCCAYTYTKAFVRNLYYVLLLRFLVVVFYLYLCL
jgi:hypothetical protein